MIIFLEPFLITKFIVSEYDTFMFKLVIKFIRIQSSLRSAKVKLEDIDYINAHGTSTPINDKAETNAIKKVFKDLAYKIPISSTKSMIGHSLGASGSLEAIACIKSIEENIIHPTINLVDQDPECDLDYVPNNAIEKELNVVLSNSFGFGGQNACLVIKKLQC
mgnify:CR=1 FL=1